MRQNLLRRGQLYLDIGVLPKAAEIHRIRGIQGIWRLIISIFRRLAIDQKMLFDSKDGFLKSKFKD